MLSAIVITAVIVVALGHAMRPAQSGDIILRRPYNNRHNDASGARDLS